MKVGVVGSRGFSDPVLVVDFVAQLPPNWTVVSGGAEGVDSWAQDVAETFGLRTIVHLPDYASYPPKQAPLERNRLIVHDSDIIVAFWDGESRGTLDTCKKARALGKKVFVVRPGGQLPSLP